MRRHQYGIVQDERGHKVVVKQRIVAEALDQAQNRIAALERAIQQGKEWDERRAVELKQLKDETARLQNHWWVLVGRGLGLLRVHRPKP